MKMRMITLALMLFVFGVQNADAQTFSPDFDADAKVTAPADDEQPVAADAEDADAEEDDENVAEDDDKPFIPAHVNIGGNETAEKDYNNSDGRVIQYKYVNGKIVFGDPADRKILVFVDNYKAEKGMDGIVKCSLRVYVLNDLLDRINNLSFKLIWPEIRTSIQMNKVNPGVRTYKDIMLLGEGCFSMDKTPTIEVNRCRVKGKSQEQCAQAIHWFKQ
jgi:hypothetical protein